MASMAIVNLIVVVLFSKIAFNALGGYLRQRRAGEDPTFNVDNIRDLKNVECWGESSRPKVR